MEKQELLSDILFVREYHIAHMENSKCSSCVHFYQTMAFVLLHESLKYILAVGEILLDLGIDPYDGSHCNLTSLTPTLIPRQSKRVNILRTKHRKDGWTICWQREGAILGHSALCWSLQINSWILAFAISHFIYLFFCFVFTDIIQLICTTKFKSVINFVKKRKTMQRRQMPIKLPPIFPLLAANRSQKKG